MGSATSKKLARLLNLVAALTETSRPLSASDLRERVDADWGSTDEAFRRAFERDKAELRELGIEIEVDEIPGSDPPEMGYRVRRDQYALRDPGLDPDEAAALHLAASLVRLDGADDGGALWKLGGRPDAAAVDAGVAALPRHPQLGPLFSAVGERRRVTFTYRDEPRVVEPARLDFARGRWYLRGHDVDRDAERVFRVDRIDGAPELGPPDAFARREEPAAAARIEPWLLAADAAPIKARVRVDAPQAPLARLVLGERAVVDETDDGSIVAELEVTHVDGFRTFVLGFLDHAEVLSPPELRRMTVEWLQAIAGAEP